MGFSVPLCLVPFPPLPKVLELEDTAHVGEATQARGRQRLAWLARASGSREDRKRVEVKE